LVWRSCIRQVNASLLIHPAGDGVCEYTCASMRLPSGLCAVLACVALAIGSVAHAQDKKACDLLTRAEVESVLA